MYHSQQKYILELVSGISQRYTHLSLFAQLLCSGKREKGAFLYTCRGIMQYKIGRADYKRLDIAEYEFIVH